MDIIEWLTQRRDASAVARDAAFTANDFLTANRHADDANEYFTALTEIVKLREQNRDMTRVLRGRIIAALSLADGGRSETIG